MLKMESALIVDKILSSANLTKPSAAAEAVIEMATAKAANREMIL